MAWRTAKQRLCWIKLYISVWSASVSDLLYVGRHTNEKLRKYGIITIGDLAKADPDSLHNIFGKIGYVLSAFARGEDQTPVAAVGEFDTFELSSDFSSSVSCKALSGPEAVQQLSAAQMSDGKVKLSWNAVSGATQYNVYSISTGEGGSDELLGTTETTSFSAENLSKGRIYRLYVRAIKVKDDITLTGDPSSQVIVDIPADESYIIGDADGSGSVDIVDATFVQRYATSIKVPVPLDTLMHADIDGDGSIGVIDATFIQRYVTFIFISYLIDCPAVCSRSTILSAVAYVTALFVCKNPHRSRIKAESI